MGIKSYRKDINFIATAHHLQLPGGGVGGKDAHCLVGLPPALLLQGICVLPWKPTKLAAIRDRDWV